MAGFEEFLKKKWIDGEAYKKAMEAEWNQFKQEYEQSGEAVFDARKKFFLNNLRLQFPLREENE